MRRVLFLAFSLILLSCNSLHSAAPETIDLVKPDKSRGSSVLKAMNDRESLREYAPGKINDQDLSDLLWAANGINRPESGKRTAPSAMNKQEIDLYVVFPEGTYLYQPQSHSLKLIAKGDHRNLVAGGQDFVKTAPLSIVMVADLSKFGNIPDDHAQLAGSLDAGIVSQNINLFCSSIGLATVPRITMDIPGLKKILNLSDNQKPMIKNPIVYPKNK